MPYSFYLFDTATWTETVPGTFFETTSGTERLIGDTTGEYGDTIVFNGYSGGQLIEISGNTLSDSTGSGSLTAPITINGNTYASGIVEMDLGFVLINPDTGIYYYVGYVTIDNVPVGSVISQGWDPSNPLVWQPSGPAVGAELALAGPITTSSPAGNPFRNNIPQLGDRFSSSNFNPFSNDVVLSSSTSGMIDDPDEIVCLVTGTLIMTNIGAIPVERLSAGDLVLTADRGYQPVRWIGSRKLDAIDLQLSPKLRPIRIGAGVLGDGLPEQDLMVSPQHRILVRSQIAENMFGSREVLVAAKQLLLVDGVEVAVDATEVEYWHFMFDQHEIVFTNGAQTESLYTGAEALKSLGEEAREEIFALFPDLADRAPDERAEGARTLLNGREGRKLAERHVMKNCNLVTGC